MHDGHGAEEGSRQVQKTMMRAVGSAYRATLAAIRGGETIETLTDEVVALRSVVEELQSIGDLRSEELNELLERILTQAVRCLLDAENRLRAKLAS